MLIRKENGPSEAAGQAMPPENPSTACEAKQAVMVGAPQDTVCELRQIHTQVVACIESTSARVRVSHMVLNLIGRLQREENQRILADHEERWYKFGREDGHNEHPAEVAARAKASKEATARIHAATLQVECSDCGAKPGYKCSGTKQRFDFHYVRSQKVLVEGVPQKPKPAAKPPRKPKNKPRPR